MNERLHEEFITFCALFHAGELSEEEWALLQVHLAYCDDCRRTFEQFQQISRDVFPVIATDALDEARGLPRESQASLGTAEARLMASVLDLPREQSAEPRKRPTRLLVLNGTLAASIAVLVTLLGQKFREDKNASPRQPSHSVISSAPVSAPTPKNNALPGEPESARLAEMQRRVSELENRASNLDATNASLRQQMQKEQAERENLVAERDNLSKQLNAAQSQVRTLKDTADSSQSTSDRQATQLASLETNVRMLNAALEDSKTTLNDRERMLALDRDFLAHDRDIRDVIGARNLYIADIFDATETGKTAKPFGRIFYTQDRSLVFYGFDLDKQPGLKQSVSFQAWGTGADRQPVSLGLFYQDDAHKRWVVRFNDAKTLSRLNMVFVTVEPEGGSQKPTGKPLLRSYLQIQPNHP